MGFNLSSWLHRQKIGVQMRTSGRPMEHRRVVNPYHAVSIDAGLRGCDQARDLEDKRFLAAEAPSLPLADCPERICRCRYVHHEDRRNMQDRRVQPHNPYAHKRGERRSGTGRRMSD